MNKPTLEERIRAHAELRCGDHPAPGKEEERKMTASELARTLEERIRAYVAEELSGVATAQQVADFLELDLDVVRNWASYASARRTGRSYAFSPDAAARLVRCVHLTRPDMLKAPPPSKPGDPVEEAVAGAARLGAKTLSAEEISSVRTWAGKAAVPHEDPGPVGLPPPRRRRHKPPTHAQALISTAELAQILGSPAEAVRARVLRAPKIQTPDGRICKLAPGIVGRKVGANWFWEIRPVEEG